MRRPAIAMILATFASGCTVHANTQRGVAAISAAVVGLGATSLLIGGGAYVLHGIAPAGGCAETEAGCNDNLDGTGSRFVSAGLILLALGAAGAITLLVMDPVADRPPGPTPSVAAATPSVVLTPDSAWGLTQEAAAAARDGDCSAVLARGRRVLALDPEFHRTVFARDAAIKECIDPERARLAGWRTYYRKHGPAAALFQQAIDKARAGDCVSVARLDGEIRQIDAEFHGAVVVLEPVIQQCLGRAADSPP